ncbi:MAG: 30S ribosomal protein S14 [Myxococcota bacterium]
MASWAKIKGNEKRKHLVAKYASKRRELKAILADTGRSPGEHADARRELERLPRNSNPTRVRNRCAVTGRPRAYYRKFGLSRIALRELALAGELPGVRKSSW